MSLTLNERRPDNDSELARRALVSVRRALAEHQGEDGPVSLTVEGEGTPLAVPREAVDLLVKILANMAAGQRACQHRPQACRAHDRPNQT